MVSLFKDRSPVAIVWLLLLSMVVHSHFLIRPPEMMFKDPSGIISYFLSWVSLSLHAVSGIVIYHIIIVVQALLLNGIFSNHKMFSQPNYLVAMVYILLSGLFVDWGNITPALLANTLVIGLYALFLRLYNYPNPKTLIYNIGLLSSCIAVFFQPGSVLVAASFYTLLVVRPFSLSEWIILLIGIITPYYFLFSILFLTDNMSTYRQFFPDMGWHTPVFLPGMAVSVSLVASLVLLVIGFVFLDKENKKLVIQVRKNWKLLVAMLMVLMPVPFIFNGTAAENVILFLFAGSPVIAKGFYVPKKQNLPIIMFWCLLIWVLLVGWGVV